MPRSLKCTASCAEGLSLIMIAFSFVEPGPPPGLKCSSYFSHTRYHRGSNDLEIVLQRPLSVRSLAMRRRKVRACVWVF